MNFPWTPPNGYEYWTDEFNSKFTRIWIKNCSMSFNYGDCEHPSAIWGFFNNKTGKYHSPINHKKPGEVVDVTDTSPFSAMILKLNPLMAAFQ